MNNLYKAIALTAALPLLTCGGTDRTSVPGPAEADPTRSPFGVGNVYVESFGAQQGAHATSSYIVFNWTDTNDKTNRGCALLKDRYSARYAKTLADLMQAKEQRIPVRFAPKKDDDRVVFDLRTGCVRADSVELLYTDVYQGI